MIDSAPPQPNHVNYELSLEFEDLKYEGENDTTEGLVVTDDDNSGNAGPSQQLAHHTDGEVEQINHDQNAVFGFSRLTYMDGVRSWSSQYASSPPPICDMPATPIEQDAPPGMVRSLSGSLSSSDGDETMSGCDDETEMAEDEPETPAREVTFNDRVRVLPIPPVMAYSLEQRFRMYANRFELRENKTRNKKEYAFDGYDWRNATEEGNMAICPLSGELLHPAHL